MDALGVGGGGGGRPRWDLGLLHVWLACLSVRPDGAPLRRAALAARLSNPVASASVVGLLSGVALGSVGDDEIGR